MCYRTLSGKKQRMTTDEILEQAHWVIREDILELEQWANENPGAPRRIRNAARDRCSALKTLGTQIEEHLR